MNRSPRSPCTRLLCATRGGGGGQCRTPRQPFSPKPSALSAVPAAAQEAQLQQRTGLAGRSGASTLPPGGAPSPGLSPGVSALSALGLPYGLSVNTRHRAEVHWSPACTRTLLPHMKRPGICLWRRLKMCCCWEDRADRRARRRSLAKEVRPDRAACGQRAWNGDRSCQRRT